MYKTVCCQWNFQNYIKRFWIKYIWAKKCSKHVETINWNELKVHSAACWSCGIEKVTCLPSISYFTMNDNQPTNEHNSSTTLTHNLMYPNQSQITLDKWCQNVWEFMSFWNVTLYLCTDVYQCFEGTHCLHLQRLKGQNHTPLAMKGKQSVKVLANSTPVVKCHLPNTWILKNTNG
jgi:hypothetical protein